ncbi:Nn.00g027600.m01.CDS01 [Neocucurbitaria sp. VM-36]
MFIDTATANNQLPGPRVIISPRTSPYNDSSTPLLETFVGQDAPPSYLEATTPGLYTSRLSGEEGAGLLAPDGHESRDARLKEEKYRRRTLRQQCTKKKHLKWIAGVLAVVTIAAILAAMLAAVTAGKDKQATVTTPPSSAQSAGAGTSSPPTLTQPSDEDKASHPDGFIDDDSDEPHFVAVPWPSQLATPARPPQSTESKQSFPIRWPSRCGKEYNVKTEEYDFGTPKELNIQEAIHQLDGHYKRVAGWIHVTQGLAEQAPGTIQAKFSYAVSPSVNVNSIQHSSTANGLMIGDPSFPDGFDGVRSGSACLGMSVVIYMGLGATLETLNVASTHMGMQIHNGVNLTVTKSTSISLTTGTLDSASLDSRETHLKTISGSISGKYSLLDLVSVKTKSGSVNINIEPKKLAEKGSQPAIFMVDAVSSSIRVDFNRKHIPERDYQTYINTTVGSVDGTFIQGSKTEIVSVAGLVTADLLPFKSGAYQSEIYTHTHSGQTSLTIRAPYKAKHVSMTGLISTHKSTSGGLDITYPDEWVGYIDGTSLSGALHLQGKDLELVTENNEPGKNHIEAKKGDAGASMMTFDTVSGECEIKVGKL